MIQRICKLCDKKFEIYPSRAKEKDRGFYCSRECFSKAQSNKFTLEGNPNWKGGIKRHQGYILIRVKKNQYLFEHRIIAEKTLGRKLLRNEVVHHINGIKDDNRPENLIVMGKGDHAKHHFNGRICPTCRHVL